GVNPRTGEASSVIGDNNFDAAVDQAVEAPLGMEDANGVIESAIAMVDGGDVTGMAIAPELRSALAGQTRTDGTPLFPDLAWGNAPATINGLAVDVNKTVSDMATNNERAYVGDF